MIRASLRPAARLLVALLIVIELVSPLAAQDASDAATQRFMEQRLEALQQQQKVLASEFEAARQSDPQRAEYLGRLIQENQVLEQRYQDRIAGRAETSGAPTAEGAVAPGPQAGGGAPASPDAQGGGMMEKVTGLLGGGGETNMTDIVISVVASLGGWYLGKMAFGPIGGIVGGIVAPMLAKWITGKVREMMGKNKSQPSTDPGGGPGGYGPMPGVGESAHGAPVFSPQKAAAQSADIAQAKAQLDAAYLALMDATQRGLPPADIAQRRNVYEQWQLVYKDRLAGK